MTSPVALQIGDLVRVTNPRSSFYGMTGRIAGFSGNLVAVAFDDRTTPFFLGELTAVQQ